MVMVVYTYINKTMENVALSKEKCVLEYQVKYPEAANNTINRLCELEEIGRNG